MSLPNAFKASIFMFAFGALVSFIVAAESQQRRSKIESWRQLCQQTAETYFMAGVQSAIAAHFFHVEAEVKAGRQPSWNGLMPSARWLWEARAVWRKQMPNDPFLTNAMMVMGTNAVVEDWRK